MLVNINMGFCNINEVDYYLLKEYMVNTYDIYISPTIYDIDDDVVIVS